MIRLSGLCVIAAVLLSCGAKDTTWQARVVVHAPANDCWTSEPYVTVTGVLDPPGGGDVLLDWVRFPVDRAGRFSCRVSLREGPNDLVLRTISNDWILGEPTVVRVNLDRRAPELAIREPPGKHYTKEEKVRFRVTVEDKSPFKLFEGTREVSLFEDETSVEFTVELPADGRNPVTVSAEDAAGNRAERTILLFRDRQPPTIALVHPPDARVWAGAEVSVVVRLSDESPAKVWVGDVLAERGVEGTFFARVTPDRGAESIRVLGVDLAGNESAPITLSVEAIPRPPRLDLVSPPEVTSDENIVVQGTVSLEATGVTIGGREAKLQRGRFRETVALDHGRNEIAVRAVGSGGRTTQRWIRVYRRAAGEHLYRPETIRRFLRTCRSPEWTRLPAGPDIGMLRARHVKTGLDFVLVPAGDLSTRGKGSKADAAIGAFLLAEKECTRHAWQSRTSLARGDPEGADLPKSGVSWPQANLYCRRSGLRLPTESEWLYACLAGLQYDWAATPFFAYGKANFADRTLMENKAAWPMDLSKWEFTRTARDGHAREAPVGSFRPNRWGFYDMLGNVCEPCQDVFRSSPLPYPKDGSPNMKGSTELRVYRGGSWLMPARFCTAEARRGINLKQSSMIAGLRPAADLLGE